MAYPVGEPVGYVAPALFTVKTVVTGLASTTQAALNSLQDNVLGIGYDLTQLVPVTNALTTNLSTVNTNILTTNNNVLIVDSHVLAQNIKFSNLSTQISKIGVIPQGVKLDNLVMTQSVSFFIGAMIAIAFVMAARVRS